mmetsp:Transcript_37058/g.69635  ORF Transcript_37058/g.69635 Transcript_37058/m.69635 type:complete len:230 (+) Transcript_37058:70-759(+)
MHLVCNHASSKHLRIDPFSPHATRLSAVRGRTQVKTSRRHTERNICVKGLCRSDSSNDLEEDGLGVVDLNNPLVVRQTQRILNSFQRTFSRPMLKEMPDGLSPTEQARYVFLADAAIISHDRVQFDDGSFDNVYNYANRAALKAFERTFQEMTSMPSSQSTASQDEHQKARNALLGEALLKGHAIYTFDRYSSTGKTIRIVDGILFNLVDEMDLYAGQAVLLENVTVLK